MQELIKINQILTVIAKLQSLFNTFAMSKKIKVKKLQGSPYAIEQDVTGRGATATIVRAYNTQNLAEELACKIISVREESNGEICKTELQVLKELPVHPNLVNYKKIQISSENNLYLIMQYCNGGNLQKYMFDSRYTVAQQKIWLFMKQFCQGYKVLYDHLMVHRDIKPENILIHNGEFKIADFGLSKILTHHEILHNFSVKGTPIYMAPQIPQHKEGNSKVDVFSLGVVLYRLAFKGKFPFFDEGRKYRSINEYFRQLKIRKLMIPENSGRSKDLIELIKQMLDKDHESRIPWKELFIHPKIIKAIRCEKKKEMTNMQTFKKSFICVNKSTIKVQEVQQKQGNEISQQDQGFLIVEQAFNKSNKSWFERKLYRYKLLYTMIEYVGNKVKAYFKNNEKVHKHINKMLNKLVVQGIEFSLFVIDSLRDISGEWDQFSTFEINNFQTIFENDREILEEQLKKILEQQQNKNYSSHLKVSCQLSPKEKSRVIKLSYEDILYRLLTQFHDYPQQLRNQIRSIVALLVDIYDMVVKFESDYNEKLKGVGHEEDNRIEVIENQEKDAFYKYLIDSQKITEDQLFGSMQKKGLLFK